MKGQGVLVLLVGGLAIGGLAAASAAEDPDAQPPAAPKAAAAKAQERDKDQEQDKKQKKDEFPPFDEVTADFKKVSPDEKTFLTLWFQEKTDELLCQVPKDMLNKRFLAAATLSGGHPMSGAQAGHTVVFWERFGKQLLLVQPDLRYAPGDKSTVADVIKRTYNDTILKAVPIKTVDAAGDVVIDLGDLLKSGLPGMSGMPVNAKLSRWGPFKTFAKNVEVPVELALGAPGGGPIERLVMHYSMSELPANPDYKPRRADDRVGYFLTVNKDWSKKHSDKTLFNRFINRWDLQKINPELEHSPVKKPMVWYVEKTVPIRWRRYVKEGILEWNRAFEKCGFLDAVQVRQQTEDNEFADLDPGDVRYNFFRWIVSGRSFAMGPSRANPLTGEILDADIIMDDSMVRVWTQRYGIFGKKATFWDEEDPLLAEFLTAHPPWNFQERVPLLLPQTVELLSPQKSNVETLLSDLNRRQSLRECRYADGLARRLAFDAAVAKAAGKDELPEEFLGQIIKEVVAHEVGHCLGLRHNFKASTWFTAQDALAHRQPDEPICGSVMDYNPTLFSLQDAEQGDYVTRTVGPYDLWAIEYGYRPVEKPFKTEEELLESITDRVAEPGHAYATDEDTFFFSPDPLSNRFDFGSDPTEYARHQMKLVEQLKEDLADWAVEDGESYSRLRQTFNTLLRTYGSQATFVARYVGGVYVHRDHKGDPEARPPFTAVPAGKQRESLRFVCDHIFSDDAWRFPPELLRKLAAGRFWHWDSDDFDMTVEFPIHEAVARIQYASLFQMMNPWTINRLYDAQMLCEDDAFSLSEFMGLLTDRIWSELQRADAAGDGFSDAEPFISSFRRGLQRQHLRLLVNIALQEPNGMMPADAHALTTMTLRRLGESIGEVLERDGGKHLDSFTRAHLMDSEKKIERTLEAVYNIRG